ncbi:MAG: hypothetical protein GF341_03730 [candidate division Zixibacteria bacterium]|nr:hypothetical protein [candidate division Zixibacteria bacterium]
MAAEDPVASRQFLYFYDANGNVGQLVETTAGAEGTIAAHYEYTPYGARLNEAALNEYDQPFRFSTKMFDAETGLGYWGYRHYSPRLGRWITRDPIGEEGGKNLYEYVRNTPSGAHDPKGRCTSGDRCYLVSDIAATWGYDSDPEAEKTLILFVAVAEAYSCVKFTKGHAKTIKNPKLEDITGLPPRPDPGDMMTGFAELLSTATGPVTISYKYRCGECKCGLLCRLGRIFTDVKPSWHLEDKTDDWIQCGVLSHPESVMPGVIEKGYMNRLPDMLQECRKEAEERASKACGDQNGDEVEKCPV